MKTVTVSVLDSVLCKVNRSSRKLLAPCMMIKKSAFRPVRGKGKKRIQVATEKNLINVSGIFLTGWLPRITDYTERKGYELVLDGAVPYIPPSRKPEIKGITFRKDQSRQIGTLTETGRGVLKAPTGSGKTILTAGIISCYPTCKILYLVHLTSILTQTKKELKKFFGPIGEISGSVVDQKRITVSTIQTYKGCLPEDPEEMDTFWDMVIVDEAHHISSLNGMYAQTLNRISAPIRVGFTATLPIKEEAVWALEGAIGPMVDELSFKEAEEKGIVVKARVRIRKVQKQPIWNHKGVEPTNYADIYRYGVVENRSFNRQVIREAKEICDSGRSVLISVTIIEHGHNLLRMADLLGLDAAFVYGATDGDVREKIKSALNRKKTRCVICSTVWKEGINIPTLDSVIVTGGKSELALLQFVGRGLRSAEGKEELLIVDFFNPSNKYFIAHFGERVSLYCDMGWMGKD